jgi:DNA-binding MarR family transcriptional regulator
MASIEEEIKQQKKFSSEYEKLAVNLLYTSGWLHNMHSARFKEFDITPEQYNVLRILRGSFPKPLMLGEITCRMLDKNSNATRLVEKLRLKGFVKRDLCPTNRRQVDIVITDKGLSLLTKIDNDSEDWSETLKSITKAEAQEVNRILDKLRS